MNSIWRRCTLPLFSPLTKSILIRTVHTSVCQKNVNTNYSKLLVNSSPKPVYYGAIRYKSKQAQHDSDDEKEVFNDDSSLNKDSKLVKFKTTSLRTDLILKSALGIARNKIEQQFYESKIRVNGKKIMKKSSTVRLGDEIDVVKMVSPKNSEHLYVYRVEILDIAAKEETIAITARRFKNLLIENYDDDPYTGNAAET